MSSQYRIAEAMPNQVQVALFGTETKGKVIQWLCDNVGEREKDWRYFAELGGEQLVSIHETIEFKSRNKQLLFELVWTNILVH